MGITLLTMVPKKANGPMQHLILELEDLVYRYVSEVVEHCTTNKEDKLLSLIIENVVGFLRPDCFEGLPPEEGNIRGRFKHMITRYLLQAGLAHGLEHFQMFFWSYPLALPQRIRKMWDLDLELADYSYDVDKSNGQFGHEMFTIYTPNPKNDWNWQTLCYDFEQPELRRIMSTLNLGCVFAAALSLAPIGSA